MICDDLFFVVFFSLNSLKVSVVGVVWLFGLYVASLSGASGACTPRVLHAIADSGVIKPITILQHTVKVSACL